MVINISTTHQRFADRLRNQRALEHPEEFLGPNWKDVLNFWIFLDTLTKEQKKIIGERHWNLDDFSFSYWAAYNAALEATNEDVVQSVWYVTSYGYLTYATYYYSSFCATNELIGSHILKSQGKSLVFLPLFLNV